MERDIQQVATIVILENFALPGVIVNERYEIIHFMGKTDKFLETPVGKASFNILSMARECLRSKLSTALHNAVNQKRSSVVNSLRIKHNGEFRTVSLTVRPLFEFRDTPGYQLVMFDDKTHSDKSGKHREEKVVEDASDPVVVSLEWELESTREHLLKRIQRMCSTY